MPSIRFVENSGKEHVVEARVGVSVMQSATDNMVPGIIADCGGSCSCATCQGYIAEPWASQLPPMQDDENGMLDGSPHRRDNSRLTCQLKVTEAMDGMVVNLPASQY